MDETVEDYLRQCEADFLETILNRDHTWLSDRQKDIIDQMSKKYLEGRDKL